MKKYADLWGEMIGTFILVFIGCGSVAVAVLYSPLELWHVALIWSAGVAIAIYATKAYCPAHLNPAVSLAMTLAGKSKTSKLLPYVISQFIGAALAAILLFTLIDSDLQAFETSKHILRGEANSYASAVMFGEFFPNPGFEDQLTVSHLQACMAEGLGTFTLVLVIFLLTAKPRSFDKLIPILIGLTVGAIIMVVAPYTQAGLNPARDFGPRVVAYFTGWKIAAFPAVSWSFLTVYILSPLVGGVAACQLQQFFSKNT